MMEGGSKIDFDEKRKNNNPYQVGLLYPTKMTRDNNNTLGTLD